MLFEKIKKIIWEKKIWLLWINFCVLETMKDYYGKCHTKECKDNLSITNYNQTLKTFNTLIQCMFSEYSGSIKCLWQGFFNCDTSQEIQGIF